MAPLSMAGNVSGTISFAESDGLLEPTTLIIDSVPAAFAQDHPADVLSWNGEGPLYSTAELGGLYELSNGSVIGGGGIWQNALPEIAPWFGTPYAVFRLRLGDSQFSEGAYFSNTNVDLYGDSVLGVGSITSPEPSVLVSLATLAAVVGLYWRRQQCG